MIDSRHCRRERTPVWRLTRYLAGRWLAALAVALLAAFPSVRSGVADTSPAPAAGAPISISLAAFRDNSGIATAPGGANFDGSGQAYDASTVPSAGPLNVGGVVYDFPRPGNDNVVALGQTIPLPAGRYTIAYLLASSTGGDTLGTFTVHYSDGSTTAVPVDVPDWYGTRYDGLITANLLFTGSRTVHHPVQIFALQVGIDPDRQAVSITIPRTHQAAEGTGSLHLFALSLQPISAGQGVKVVGARSTSKTTAAGAQIVEATVENIGTDWYSAAAPTTVAVEGYGVTTTAPVSLTALAPGEESVIEIPVTTAPSIPAGSRLDVQVVAHTADGHADGESVDLTAGIPDYTATIGSLQQHESPDWYNGAKFGIFIHWGLYSVPAWAPVGGVYAEWYWYSMQQRGSPTYRHELKTYGKMATYDGFIPRFTASRFDPHAWVELFKEAGARYFVFVAKHHDGFALFRTAVSHRDSVHLGPHRDLVKMLFDADRRYTPQIHPGIYYSLPEWYNPAYPRPIHHFPGGPPRQYVTGKVIPYTGYISVRSYVQDYQLPQMLELIDQYHPDILWCDIGGPNDSVRALAHFYDEAQHEATPRQVVANNRCGVRPQDFMTPEYRTFPATVPAKWEATRGIDPHSFGYNALTPPAAYASAQSLVDELVDVVSKNGNFLLDIGPRADGSIPDIMAQRLRQIGAWLRINGEAIYDTNPWWRTPQDGNLRFTVKPGHAFYITSLVRPGSQILLHQPVPIQPGDTITLLGWNDPPLHWTDQNGRLAIGVPAAAQVSGQYAWVFKITWHGS
jgi:alpha-L-fucosidase